jgi:CHASE1-domain containing sensor protein
LLSPQSYAKAQSEIVLPGRGVLIFFEKPNKRLQIHHMSEAAVITLVIVLVSAAAAIAITVRIIVSVKNSNKSNRSNQTGNTVGGDQAGRDVIKK